RHGLIETAAVLPARTRISICRRNVPPDTIGFELLTVGVADEGSRVDDGETAKKRRHVPLPLTVPVLLPWRRSRRTSASRRAGCSCRAAFRSKGSDSCR